MGLMGAVGCEEMRMASSPAVNRARPSGRLLAGCLIEIRQVRARRGRIGRTYGCSARRSHVSRLAGAPSLEGVVTQSVVLS